MSSTGADWSLGEQSTVTDILEEAVAQWPDHTFLEFPDGKLSFREFNERSDALANGLQGRGVQAGETVVTMLDNNLECVLSWFAINKIGAIWVPVNTAYKGDFLKHIVRDAGARIVLAERDYVERLALIEESVEEVSEVYSRNGVPGVAFNKISLNALESLYVDGPLNITVTNRPSDISKLIYTGGTTGPSKGCMVSHNYACSLARQSLHITGKTHSDVHWSCLPLFHMNATSTTVLSSAMVGCKAYFTPRFSLSGFWSSIEKSGATVVNILGTMVPLIANAPDEPAMERCHGQIRVLGAAPVTEELQKKYTQRYGIKHVGSNGYGLTEATMLTSQPCGTPVNYGASGRRNEWFDVRIVDDEGSELPPGKSGEIIARPLQPNIMYSGYWKRPEDTLRVTKDLWFHTGDIGMFDEDGFFYFVDRKKDYLRRGGENISSFEMESTVNQHEAVKEVAVHAVLSELSEDEVKVTAVLKESGTLTEEELCLWMIERVPYFAVPRYIEFRNELPKNPVGRVLKYELRDQGYTATTWDRSNSNVPLVKR